MLIKYNEARILGFAGHLIKPGINDLPSEVVADMQDDDMLAYKFDNELLEIVEVEGVKKKKGEKKASGMDLLLRAPEKEAVKLVAQTVDMVVLEAWLGDEKRLTVKKALKAQIAKIKNVKFRDDGKKKEKEEE